jgi:uncharacterized membrane protein
MSRKEFMEELENMLGNIQDAEREEALQYYNDYFDEAGPDNEQQVIMELGTPAKVAAIIKTSLQENMNESGEFSETGYSDPRFKINYEVVDSNPTGSQQNYNKTGSRERKYAKETSGGKIALIVILCILALPVIVPVVGGVLGVIFGALGVVIGFLAVIALLAVALPISGVVVFVTGVITLFTSPIVGIFCCGVGLLLLGIGVLFILLTGVICVKFIPWFVRGIIDLCRLPFQRRGII